MGCKVSRRIRYILEYKLSCATKSFDDTGGICCSLAAEVLTHGELSIQVNSWTHTCCLVWCGEDLRGPSPACAPLIFAVMAWLCVVPRASLLEVFALLHWKFLDSPLCRADNLLTVAESKSWSEQVVHVTWQLQSRSQRYCHYFVVTPLMLLKNLL